MASRSNTRVTVDIPTVNHKKIKMIAAYYGKSMKEIFIEMIERGLESYKECPLDHTPNAITKKAIENINAGKGLQEVATVDELFKKLNE